MTLKRKSWYIGIILFDSAYFRDVKIVPGLYKIFDEILVNAADNKIRDPNMDHIKVIVDRENGTISIHNNGRGIPIEIHEVYPFKSDLIS
jgi:DNA topoisomerase II